MPSKHVASQTHPEPVGKILMGTILSLPVNIIQD